jgi:hypothetical protein
MLYLMSRYDTLGTLSCHPAFIIYCLSGPRQSIIGWGFSFGWFIERRIVLFSSVHKIT